jgi:hypothetical protein
LIAFFPDYFQDFEMILNALKITCVLRVPGRVDIVRGFCDRLQHSGISGRWKKCVGKTEELNIKVNDNVKYM